MSTKATSEKTQRDLIKYKTRFPSVSMKNVAPCEISTVNIARASIFYNATKHTTNSARKRSMPYCLLYLHIGMIIDFCFLFWSYVNPKTNFYLFEDFDKRITANLKTYRWLRNLKRNDNSTFAFDPRNIRKFLSTLSKLHRSRQPWFTGWNLSIMRHAKCVSRIQYTVRGGSLYWTVIIHTGIPYKRNVYAYVSKHRFISPEICEKDLFPRQSRCNHGQTKICVFKNEINSEGACRKRIMSIKES